MFLQMRAGASRRVWAHQVHERVCSEMMTVTVRITLVSTTVPTLHTPYPLRVPPPP